MGVFQANKKSLLLASKTLYNFETPLQRKWKKFQIRLNPPTGGRGNKKENEQENDKPLVAILPPGVCKEPPFGKNFPKGGYFTNVLFCKEKQKNRIYYKIDEIIALAGLCRF